MRLSDTSEETRILHRTKDVSVEASPANCKKNYSEACISKYALIFDRYPIIRDELLRGELPNGFSPRIWSFESLVSWIEKVLKAKADLLSSDDIT